MGSIVNDNEVLEEIIYSGINDIIDDLDVDITVQENEHIDSGRWVQYYRVVWHESGNGYFAYDYSRSSTEYQEGSEDELDYQDIYEVEAEEVTVTKYKKKS